MKILRSLIVIIAVKSILFGCVYPGLASFAFAGEMGVLPGLRLSGYGTLSYTVDDSSTMAPIRDIAQRPEDGYETGATWLLDSRIGLQADYRLNQQLEFVVQGVLKDQNEIDFNSSIESAFAGFRPLTNLDIRAGRIGYDVFLMSDTRDLGYAYSWVRPPTEFYGWIPIFSVDGIDAAYTFDEGDALWKIKAQAGLSRVSLPMDKRTFDFQTNNLISLTLSRQSGPLRLKAGYSQFTCDSEAKPLALLHAGLDAVSSATAQLFPDISKEASNLRANLSFDNARIEYLTLGASYDDGEWIAQAEIGHTTSTVDVVPHGMMGYIGLGRRFGDWTPYILASFIRPAADSRKASSDWNLIGQEAFHSQALFVVNTTRMEQNTGSLGVRWDFHNQAAMKLQWDSTHVKSSGYGLWWRSLGSNDHDKTINMLTFSMEFVL